ncbi:CPBP family intramembrane glutamic endopeptidase [Sutcliffiella halmapala]|uniref:CPBP family intramembrane glutamic endopeptidase n=1 Tax=Sutcliffiella halmapala TaxID=79882 RepID=UPI0009951F11|nr:type II CAAX endopeptidase family protein [Sutcliffiella halmapala]
MTKKYWYVILTYVLMQLSGVIGFPILLGLGVEREHVIGYWTFISFTIGLLIVCWILRKEWKEGDFRGPVASVPKIILWSFLGFFMALFGQAIAAQIELHLFGIDPGSENTQQIMGFVTATPIMIFAITIAGPILEEVIFRKIIFGSLYKRFNFAVGLIVSSLLFAVVHQDFSHLLIYFVMGAIFAFLYVKTNRIIVPIIAHVAMNSFVVVVQYVFREDIEELLKQMEEMQNNLPNFITFF